MVKAISRFQIKVRRMFISDGKPWCRADEAFRLLVTMLKNVLLRTVFRVQGSHLYECRY